jgi:Tetratricopeptide repeat
MDHGSFHLRALLVVGITLLSQAAIAQKSGPASGTSNIPSRTNVPPPNANADLSSRPMFISGKVMLAGGGLLPEPVAIERACNGVLRREGYSDSKGQFSFQLGVNNAFQDASEGGSRIGPRTPNSTTARTPTNLVGCEFRAVLAGYQSTVATLRTDGETWQIDLGTIFLKRLGNAQGTTISLTSMAAPKDAMHAYEKAQKLMDEKPDEAEKNLNKAVEKYPNFAAAWNLLGDLKRKDNKADAAREAYARAIQADPQFVNPVYSMALLFMQSKKWEEAIQYSGQVVKLDAAAFPLAYFFNAAANYNLQKYEAAEDTGKKFKALDTQHVHPDVCLLLSYIYARKQDYKSAAQEIRDYLAAVPNSPNADSLQKDLKQFEDLSISAKKE